MYLTRREFIQMLGLGVASGLLGGCSQLPSKNQRYDPEFNQKMYEVPLHGQARILHITDTHAQLNPIYYREPNVNLGLGRAVGQFPHLVGQSFMENSDLIARAFNTYAFTHSNFSELSDIYGKVGGFAHLKTLLEQLREQAGGRHNTLTLDGGDLWQGSATALWTRGKDMVGAANLLGVEAQIGHWEFTYSEPEVLSNISDFKGVFLGQNVRIKEDALLDDHYFDMTDKYGHGLEDEDTGHAFKPFVIKQVGGHRLAVIGQCFPRTANANPQSNFPNWSFGLREEALQALVQDIRAHEKPAAIILLSHNGMDVDLKMASRVVGIDAILGGHTHDAIPKAIAVKNSGGQTWVTNAGSNGKFVGVMDLDFAHNRVTKITYKLLPVFSNLIAADAEMTAYIQKIRSTSYDESIIESRRSEAFYHKDRMAKTYAEILQQPLAIAGETLYRRGNFIGTWDQVTVNALREAHDTQIAFSPGVRWGTSIPAGDTILMEHVFDQTALTYGESYRSTLSGAQIKSILEGVAENLFVQDPYLQSGGDMVRVGGMDYSIDPSNSYGNRISDLSLDDGSNIDMNKQYTVAGWAQVNEVGEGPLIWDVVSQYLQNHKTIEFEKINYPTLKNVMTNPGVVDYGGKLS